MPDPLTRSQQRLRGREVADMSDAQLDDWVDACTKMELHIKHPKARRSWKEGRHDALAEIERRAAKRGNGDVEQGG